MFESIILCASLIGPVEFHPKQTLYILVDSTSPDPEVARRSKIAKNELFIDDERFMYQEHVWINSEYKIVIEELVDKYLPNKPNLPCFKVAKNDGYTEFCPGTFSSSGTFTLSVYSLLKNIKFLDDWGLWKNIGIRQTISVDVEYVITWNKYTENKIIKWSIGKVGPEHEIQTYNMLMDDMGNNSYISKEKRSYWIEQPPTEPLRYPDKMFEFYRLEEVDQYYKTQSENITVIYSREPPPGLDKLKIQYSGFQFTNP